MAKGMLPKAGVCEKRQGGGCHEGPYSRRLRKGEGSQQEAVCKESCRKATDCGTTAKANAGKDCERKRRPSVRRRRKRKLERLWKGESCRGKRKSGRVRRELPRAAVFQKTAKKANVAEGDRVQKTAKEANAGGSNDVQ